MNAFKLFGLGALFLGATASLASAQSPYGYGGSSCAPTYSSGAYRTQPYVNSGAYGNAYGGFSRGYSAYSAPRGHQHRQPYAAQYGGGSGYQTRATYDPVHGDYHVTPAAPQRPYGYSASPWSQW